MSEAPIQAEKPSVNTDSPEVNNHPVASNPQPVPENTSSAPENNSRENPMDLLMDVNLQMAVELGRTRLKIRDVLDLQKGSVIELNRTAGEPVDIYINNHLIGRGEVVVVDDNFGIRITELLSPKSDSEEA